MGTTYHNKPIVTDGLVFCVDPANKVSWSGPDSSTVNDLIGTNTSTIYNDTSGSYGDNNSFAFDGVDDFIQTNFSQDVTNDFSVFSWINVDSPSNSKYYILGTREESTSASTSKGFTFNLNSSRQVWARIFTTTSNITQVNSGVVTNGIWANVAFTYIASTKTLKIYRNGIEMDSVTGTAAGVTSPDNLEIGRAAIGGLYGYFDGNIGPIQIYNKALSASEIMQNYNALKNRFI